MTETLDATRRQLIDAIDAIGDPVERLQKVIDLEAQLKVDIKQAKARIARQLKEGRTWDEVGEVFGVTGARAEQISRASR